MKSAVIITTDNYPCGDAGAVRAHAFAKMLQDLEYHVVVLGYGRPTAGKKGCYDGVDYVTFRPGSNNRLIRGLFRLFVGIRMVRYLRTMAQKPEVLLVAEVPNRTYGALERFAKTTGCKLIHDSVEWYSPEQFSEGSANRTYRIKDKLNREIINEQWSVIAISKFLQVHFERISQKSVYVPVIMEMQSISFRTAIISNSDKICFVYAGSPGRKDYLAVLLEGFSMLCEDQLQKLEIHLYGITRQQLVDICGVDENVIAQLGTSLNAHGRVSREEAVRAVMDADYSMLLRDENLRYAKAGFPTKIVECLACGTVPFCNLSSDLALYLRDGENAILIDDHTPQAVKIAAEKVFDISMSNREKMRANARKTAEDHFNYRRYIEVFNGILK